MKDRVEPVVTPPEPEADVKLMAAVAAKDPAAQRQLLERVGRRVRGVTGLLCRSAADADDAAQLSLIEILKSAGSFRTATSLERWAERIAVRTTMRSARRERERRGLMVRWISPGSLPWGRTAAASSSEQVGVDALLERLSPERRRVFVLRHALDYTVEEIAELTDTPVGTVKDRLVSARKQLRGFIEREARRSSRRGGAA